MVLTGEKLDGRIPLDNVGKWEERWDAIDDEIVAKMHWVQPVMLLRGGERCIFKTSKFVHEYMSLVLQCTHTSGLVLNVDAN